MKLVPFAILVLCLGGCSGEGPADTGTGDDAGIDAGLEPLDAGADGGLDAADPGGVDTGGVDAPSLDAADAGTADGGLDALRCETTPACPPGQVCTGIDEDGIGRCRDLTPIPGEGESCGADAECDPGLICTQTRPGGTCVPAWMLGSFSGEALEIPDEDPVGATAGTSVGGLGTVSTEVVLRFRLEHGRSADVRVYLANPAGTEVLAWNGNASDEPVLPVRDIERVVAGFPGDESANGRWLLRAADLDPAETGRILSWSITLRSRFD